jgi:hypothetical protein
MPAFGRHPRDACPLPDEHRPGPWCLARPTARGSGRPRRTRHGRGLPVRPGNLRLLRRRRRTRPAARWRYSTASVVLAAASGTAAMTGRRAPPPCPAATSGLLPARVSAPSSASHSRSSRITHPPGESCAALPRKNGHRPEPVRDTLTRAAGGRLPSAIHCEHLYGTDQKHEHCAHDPHIPRKPVNTQGSAALDAASRPPGCRHYK